MTLGDWIDGIAEEIREDLREEVTKEVMEEVTSKVTEEVTSKVTEEVTSKVTEEVTSRVTEEVTSKVTEEITTIVTEDSIKNTIEIYCEYHASKDEIVDKVRIKFPKYADKAEMYVEKYWKLDKE